MRCGGRAKTTVSPLGTSPSLHGLYSSLYLPTSCIIHMCVCDQLLKITLYSTSRPLLLYGGPCLGVLINYRVPRVISALSFIGGVYIGARALHVLI